MRRIGALLPTEIHARIAGIVVAPTRLVARFAYKTLLSRPRLDQRPVDGEMLIRQQPMLCGHCQHRGEKHSGDVARQQPVAVLAEGRRVPDHVIQVEPHKPAEEQIVVELLHQQPLAADRVEHLQQQRPQQLLLRDRRAPHAAVELVEQRRHLLQRRIRPHPDHPQGMILRDPLLRRHIAEHGPLDLIRTSHRPPPPHFNDHALLHALVLAGEFFSSLVEFILEYLARP